MTSSRRKELIEECVRLTNTVLQPISDRTRGPLDKESAQNTSLPFVLILGNHSSGKSSFVNFVCQKQIQTSGVAPNDDAFTIITSGKTDYDVDGPALVGNPDQGFSGLNRFGDVLVHRTMLKVRSGINPDIQFMIVDTPGMIDSPMVRNSAGEIKHAVMDRGYDFEKVCRWYAERADVILLFFDPDKPGTTGETLQVLTNSLAGLDHKLHIILNKADQFRKIHDFARAYGSLCWNLSKVIPRKDLPQIHTMCLPLPEHTTTASSAPSSFSNAVSNENDFLRQGFIDLEISRNAVLKEIFNAPLRRVDHEISRLSDNVKLMTIHCRVVDCLSEKLSDYRFNWNLGIFTVSTFIGGLGFFLLSPSDGRGVGNGGGGVNGGGSTASVLVQSKGFKEIIKTAFSGGLAPFMGLLGGGTAAAIGTWIKGWFVERFVTNITSESGLQTIFESLYQRQLRDDDKNMLSLWDKVRKHLSLHTLSEVLGKFQRIRKEDFVILERLLERDVASLRRCHASEQEGH